MHWLKRLLTPPLIVLAALVMACEEWVWERLKWLTGLLSRFRLVHWYETTIVRLPLSIMVFVFLLPEVTLIPVKLLGVYWLARGYWLASVTTLVTAKVLGTALVARTYVVCKSRLMTIGWFKRGHDWLIATRDRLYSALRAMPTFQYMRDRLLAFRDTIRKMKMLLRRKGRRGLFARWCAIRRLHRIRRHRAKELSGHRPRG